MSNSNWSVCEREVLIDEVDFFSDLSAPLIMEYRPGKFDTSADFFLLAASGKGVCIVKFARGGRRTFMASAPALVFPSSDCASYWVAGVAEANWNTDSFERLLNAPFEPMNH